MVYANGESGWGQLKTIQSCLRRAPFKPCHRLLSAVRMRRSINSAPSSSPLSSPLPSQQHVPQVILRHEVPLLSSHAQVLCSHRRIYRLQIVP
jgi:hypothetical protein